MTTERSPVPIEIAAEIRQGVTHLARRMRSGRSPEALSSNKVSVLSHLHRHGPTSPGELAAVERMQPQSLTRVFGELESEGLVSRKHDARDRRRALLSVTPAGRAALSRDTAERDAWLATQLAALSDIERDLLLLAARLMDRIAYGDAESQIIIT